MAFKKEFNISNPSVYQRSDYIEVDFDHLEIPKQLDEYSLKLSRIYPDGTLEEIDYQIDNLLGEKRENRLLTFFADHIPPSGSDDYDKPSASYLLEEASPRLCFSRKDLYVENFYSSDEYQEINKFSKVPKPIGVKLHNNRLHFYFCLVPHPVPGKNMDINFAGAVTNIEFKDLKEAGAFTYELLSLFWNYPQKRWGQLTHVSFFPLPWQLEGFENITIPDKKYELIYSKSGPIRAVISVKIGPIDVVYKGEPLFATPERKIKSNIYRIIYVYPDCPFYIEEILSETIEETSISFRPYYTSVIHFPNFKSQLKRFESIPDYFSLWKSFAHQHYGFGFAADAHVRQIQLEGDTIRWRLPFSHHKKCINYFMHHGIAPHTIDLFHSIGHNAWYEKVFKPMEVIPYKKRFPAPTLDDYEAGEGI